MAAAGQFQVFSGNIAGLEGGVKVPAVLGNHRLVVERSESDCVDGNGHGRRASCASQDSTTIESLRAQIMRLEGELARTRTAHVALRERCRIGTQALRELCVTAAAMHGRALCGLEDAALDDDAPTD